MLHRYSTRTGLTLVSLAEDVNRLRRAKRFQYFHNKRIVLDHREHEALEIQIKAVDMGLQVQSPMHEAKRATKNRSR